MAYPVIAAPDDELAVVQYLRSTSALTALIPAAKIVTELPDKPAYPYLLVSRIGGLMAVPQRLDEPAIQIDSVGGTKYVCKQIILTARAAILAIANDTVPAGVLSSAVEEVGPSWLPDTIPTPPIPRYTARFRVFLHI